MHAHFLIVNILLIFGIFINEHTCDMDSWESWSFEELEKQVSPSRWNPNKFPDDVIKDYVNFSIQGTQQALESIPHNLSIPYGPKSRQQYDIYGTDLKSNAPIYVWLHGGFWQEGSKDLAGMLANNLHAHGIRNIVLGYTLAPTVSVKDIEGEVVLGLKHIVKQFPDALITVGGHSAGAQLAAMLLHTEFEVPEVYSRIEGLHLVSGIYNLRPIIPTYVNDLLKLSRSSADISSPLAIRKIRDDFLNKSSTFKISIIVAKYDSDLFQQQAQDYYKLLKKTFPHTTFWKSEEDDHFTIVQNLSKTDSEAGKQFEKVEKLISEPDTSHPHEETRSNKSSAIALSSSVITMLALFLSFG